MKFDIEIDEQLWAKARQLAGNDDPSALVEAGLRALIERESARRLAKLGGSAPQLGYIRRRRIEPD